MKWPTMTPETDKQKDSIPTLQKFTIQLRKKLPQALQQTSKYCLPVLQGQATGVRTGVRVRRHRGGADKTGGKIPQFACTGLEAR